MSKEGKNTTVLLGLAEDGLGNPLQYVPIRLNTAGELVVTGGSSGDIITPNSDNVATTLSAQATASIIYGFDGTAFDRIRSVGTTTDSIGSTLQGVLETVGHGYLFNNVTWERARSNGEELELFQTLSRTVESFSTQIANINWRGLTIFFRVIVDNGAVLTLTLQELFGTSGTWIDMPVSMSISGTGNFVMKVYPGIAETATTDFKSFDHLISRKIRLKVTPSNANSMTYVASASMAV